MLQTNADLLGSLVGGFLPSRSYQLQPKRAAVPGRSGSDYQSEVTGWSQWDQPNDILWYEVPEGDSIQDHIDPNRVEGVWVHTWNVDDPRDEHWFWVRSYMPLSSWDEWDDLIWHASDQHNMALA